jgi:prepilin-type processing-associated H-X9-DG protein
MRNVGLAVTQFETGKRHFPGYVNMLSGTRVTWPVMILPQVGRNDLYDDWRSGRTTAGPIEVFRCPSAEPGNNPAPLSFVANSGRAAGPEKLANGIFVDLAANTAAKMTTGYLDSHDGASYTLLVSENLNAASWAAAANAKATTGFVWHDTTSPIRRINGQPQGAAASLDAARPSSAHSGGVNSAFCDGNMRFLSDELDYDVYKQLMTSYGRASDDRTNRTLFETDY